MADIEMEVTKVLEHFDQRSDSFDETEISDALQALKKQYLSFAEPLQEIVAADVMAFRFADTSNESPSPWGTYFGPLISDVDKDGNAWEVPNIQLVTPDVLETWKARCEQFCNPIMRARYADLVWDLSQTVVSEKPDVKYAKMAIDAYIQIANEKRFEYYLCVVTKLRRAISLTLTINDKSRSKKAKEAFLKLATVTDTKEPSRWVRVYDSLIRDHRKLLNPSEKDNIIKGLEDALARCSNHEVKEGFDPFEARDISLRLAEYYKQQSSRDDICRVLLAFETAFEPLCNQTMSLQAMLWYERIYEAYQQYGLKENADRVLCLMRDKGKDAAGNMGGIRVEQKIPRKELENALAWLVEDDLESALWKLAVSFLFDVQQEKEMLWELAKTHPILALIPISVMDQDQVIAKAGSVREDFDRRLVGQIADSLSFATALLEIYIDKLREHYSPTPEVLLEICYRSPLYDPDRRDLLNKGMTAYLNGDFVVAIHLLVPQIEHILRKFLTMVGGTILKPNRNGGYKHKNLNDILRELLIRQVMDEEIKLYLQTLLADPLGWNLRNLIAHGLLPVNGFCRQAADRIFHVLILLSGFRQ